MVLEQIVGPRWLEKRHWCAFAIGFFYVAIGILVSYVAFRKSVSTAMVFFTTMLLIPSLLRLLDIEEDIDRKEGLRHFFHNHKDIFEAYLFLFLGIFLFVVLFGVILSNPNFNSFFSYQMDHLNMKLFHPADPDFKLSDIHGHSVGSKFGEFQSILFNNISVNLFAFIISFFYGAGAIFLIVYNATLIAAAIGATIKSFFGNIIAQFKNLILLLLIMSIHLIPEVAGYLVAAIAGGLISKAVLKEQVFSYEFNRVVEDGIVLFIVSLLLLILAAFLEVYVTTLFL